MTSTPESAGSPARSAGEPVPNSPTVASVVEETASPAKPPSDPDNRPATSEDDETPNDVILDPAITGDQEADPAVHDSSEAQALSLEDTGAALATLASLSAQDSAQQGLKRRMSGSFEEQEGAIKHLRRDETSPPSPRQHPASPAQRSDIDEQQQRDTQSTSDNMLRSPMMVMPVHYQHMSPAMTGQAHLPPDHNPYASSASAMFQSGVSAQLAHVQSPTESQPAGGAPYFPSYPHSAVSYDSPYSNSHQSNNWNMQGYNSNMPSNAPGLGLSESGRPHLDRSVSHEDNMRMGGSMDMAGVPGGPGLMNPNIGGSGYGGESSIRGNGIAENAFDLYNPQDQGVHDLNASDSLLNLHSGGMYPGSLVNAQHNQDPRSATLQSPSMSMSVQMDQHPGSGDDDGLIPMLGGANAKARDEKQRKRIIQACEPCRIRKAKCNGLQPCGRCGQRGLDCLYASERRMRGPNKVKKSQTEKEQANRDRQQRKAAERHAQDVAAAAAAIQAVSNPHHHIHPHHQVSTMIDDDIQITSSTGPIDGMRPPFSPHDNSRGIKDEPEMEMSRSLLSAYDASNGNPNSASLHQHGQLLNNWPGSGFNLGPPHYNMEGMNTSASRDYDRSDRTTDQRMFYGNHPPTPGAGGQADFVGGQYQGLVGYAGGHAVSASPPNHPPAGSSYPREYYAPPKSHRSPLISGGRGLEYDVMEEGTAAASPPYEPHIPNRFADLNMTNSPIHHVRTGSNTDLNISSVRGAAEVARDSHLRSSANVGSAAGAMSVERGLSGTDTPTEGNAVGRASIAGLLLGDLARQDQEQESDQDPPGYPEDQ